MSFAARGACHYTSPLKMNAEAMTAPTLEYPALQGLISPGPTPAPMADRVVALADRHRYKLFAFLVAWYLLGFNGQWRLEPDSALYLTIGRNLAEGQGYTYHGEPHRLAFPGPPLLFAAVFKLSHGQHLLPALVLMLSLGFVTLALTYRVFLLAAGRPTAVLMTFGLGISRLFYRYCFELLSDLPFLLGVMAVLVGYEAVFYRRGIAGGQEDHIRPPARWFVWVLLVGGLVVAVIMRPTMWALLSAIVLSSIWSVANWRRPGQPDGGRTRLPQILVVLFLVAAVAGFSLLDPRHAAGHTMGQYEDALFEARFSHLGAMLRQTFTEYIPLLFESAVCKAALGCPIGVGLNTIAGAVVLLLGIGLVRVRPLWGLWVAMTAAVVLVAVKPLDRYFLEVLPLFVYAWWRGIRWLNLRLPRPWGDRVFLSLFLLGGATNILRTGEFIFEQRHPQFRSYYKEGRFASADRVAKLVHDNVGPNDWVIAPLKCGRILTFLSRRNVTEAPAEAQLDARRSNVFVLEPPSDSARQWLASAPARLGPQVGPTIQGNFDPDPWRLHRVDAGR